jgi:hypothetical protein
MLQLEVQISTNARRVEYNHQNPHKTEASPASTELQCCSTLGLLQQCAPRRRKLVAAKILPTARLHAMPASKSDAFEAKSMHQVAETAERLKRQAETWTRRTSVSTRDIQFPTFTLQWTSNRSLRRTLKHRSCMTRPHRRTAWRRKHSPSSGNTPRRSFCQLSSSPVALYPFISPACLSATNPANLAFPSSC